MAARRKDREQGIYRRVTVRMWGDAKVMALSRPQPNGQTLWIHLLTGEQTDIIPGLCKIGEAAFAEQLGWAVEAFREAFAEVSRLGMAKADWTARVVWVPKAIEHNAPISPNVVTSWADAWDRVPECALKLEAWRVLRAFLEGMSKAFVEAFDQACPKPSPMPSGNQEQEQEQDQEQEEAAPQPPAAGSPESGTEALEAPPVPPSAPAAPAEARRAPAAATAADPVEAFQRQLEARMCRPAPFPLGGGGEVLKQIAAALQKLPIPDAVELVYKRDVEACTSGSQATRPRTLKLVASMLADEVSKRAALASKPKLRRAVGVDEQGQPVFAEVDS